MKNFCTFIIRDTEIGLKFGLESVRQIYEKSQLYRLSDEDDDFTPLGMAHVLYAGYINNQLVKELPAKFTLEDFVDHVEDAVMNRNLLDVIAALQVFQESKTIKDIVKAVTDAKKKTPPKRTAAKKNRK